MMSRTAYSEPVAAGKRDLIVAAARSLFIEMGFGAASMDEVARRAGVAKQTVYNHFGSKSALFQAIVEQICDDLMSTVNVAASTESDPARALSRLAQRFVRIMVDPVSIGLFRLLAAEAHRFPELAETVFEAGPDRVVNDLARYLGDQHRAGYLHVVDAKLSAELFIGALRGNIEVKAVFSGPERLAAIGNDTALLDRYSGHCVAAFLRAHAPVRVAR